MNVWLVLWMLKYLAYKYIYVLELKVTVTFVIVQLNKSKGWALLYLFYNKGFSI